jgi:hypothetical protein
LFERAIRVIGLSRTGATTAAPGRPIAATPVLTIPVSPGQPPALWPVCLVVAWPRRLVGILRTAIPSVGVPVEAAGPPVRSAGPPFVGVWPRPGRRACPA